MATPDHTADAARNSTTSSDANPTPRPRGSATSSIVRHGRHFADDVAGELSKGLGLEEAIEAAVARWMGWRIDRRTNRDEGIPAGLPYLTGWVTHFQILDEMQA